MFKKQKVKTYPQESFPFETLSLYKLMGRYDQVPVSFWPASIKEIQKIVSFASQINDCKRQPTIVDIGCGNALLSFLMAREGASVIGIDPNKTLLRRTPYMHPNLLLKTMPYGHNYS